MDAASGTLTARSQETHIGIFPHSWGGKLIKNGSGYVTPDRLGSIGKYYPYGQERPSATSDDKVKFGTYYRDDETGLDYAMNRYHDPGDGRFMTPDPMMSSANPSDPGSWNRYSYVAGDPVNLIDPTGLISCNELLTKINRLVYGNNSLLQPSKGIKQRIYEQIYGRIDPTQNGWDTHNTAISNLQKSLKKAMKDFIDDKCPPPSGGKWKYFDYWANRSLPTAEEYKGPSAAPLFFWVFEARELPNQLFRQEYWYIPDWHYLSFVSSTISYGGGGTSGSSGGGGGGGASDSSGSEAVYSPDFVAYSQAKFAQFADEWAPYFAGVSESQIVDWSFLD